MSDIYKKLLSKGFSKKEALETIKVIEKAKKERSPKIKFLDSIIYWCVLLVAIIGNLVISILLIPFLLAFRKIPLYLTIIILAGMFGFLFDQLIRDIEFLEKKHYIIAGVFIPGLAVVNTYYMAAFANHLTKTLSLPTNINSPILISAMYAIAFIIPYIIRTLAASPSKY